jgi:Predicted oxidoreductases (related to aryl-alcohol dehydrogenases)
VDGVEEGTELVEDVAAVTTAPVAASSAGTVPAASTVPAAPITTAETAAIVGSEPAVRRRVGPSELRVFPVALSGNVFGWTADSAESERILDAYVARGGNFVDTADSYAGGRSEIILGNWLRSRGRRDDIVLATKIGKSADHPGLSARAIRSAVEASLRRLRTDRIDLLYLHIDDPEVPFEETLLAVDELVRAGKVRFFGGSDHTGDRLYEARIASAQLGVAHMVAVQNQYHLLHRREVEGGLARVARDLSLGVMPRFALAGGFLTGKYRSKADLASSTRTDLKRYLKRRGLRVLAALDAVAAEHDAPPATVALAWLLSKPGVVAPVVSASGVDQVFDLAAAAHLRLTRSQLTALDRASD